MSTIQINHPQLSVQVAPGADTGRARLTFSVDISKSSLNNLIRLLDAALPPGQELIIDRGKFSHSKKSFRPPRPENMEQVLREKSQYPSSPRPQKSSNVDQPKSILKKGSPTTAEASDKSKKKKVSFNLPTNKPEPSSKMPAAFQGLKSELKGLPQELIIPDPILNLMDKETLGYRRVWEPGLPFLVPKDVEVDEKTAKEAVEFMKKRAESRTGQAATAPPVIDSRYGDSLDHSRAINRSRRRSMSAPQTQTPQHNTTVFAANSHRGTPSGTRPAGGIKQAPPSTVKGASDQSPAPDRANGKPSNSGPLKTAQNFFKSIVNFLLPNFRA